MILMTGIFNRLPIMYEQAFLHIIPLKWTNISVFTKDYGGVSPMYAITVLCALCIIFILLIMHKSKSYSIEMMEDY